MTNDHSQFPLRTNHFLNPKPPKRESLSINSTNIKPRDRSNTNENNSLKSAKQIYTFSNPPRELQRNRKSFLRQRVSSAPDENSPRSRLNQPKSSSATGSLTPRAHDDINHHSIQSIPSINHVLKHDEQQKDSFNALMKEQEKSKVPKAVQKRRLILHFHRSSQPRQEQNSSSISDINQIQTREDRIFQTNNQNEIQLSQSSGLSDNIEAEMADSMQLAAILANIQLQDDGNSNEIPLKHQQTTLDPSKYEYVVPNSLDTATYKLSPRTLKPTEELAARLRFAQYYRSEMRSSANAQIPLLMASIVTENNSTMGISTATKEIFKFKLDSTDPMKKQSSTDNNKPISSTMEEDLVDVYYDEILNGFYDPNMHKYYELKSE